GDDRLVDPVQPASDPAEAQVHDLANPARACIHVVRGYPGSKVGAGAEAVPCPGEDRYVDRVVLTKVPPDPTELVVHREVDGVLRCGSVQGADRDPVALLVADGLEHVTPPMGGREDRRVSPVTRGGRSVAGH